MSNTDTQPTSYSGRYLYSQSQQPQSIHRHVTTPTTHRNPPASHRDLPPPLPNQQEQQEQEQQPQGPAVADFTIPTCHVSHYPRFETNSYHYLHASLATQHAWHVAAQETTPSLNQQLSSSNLNPTSTTNPNPTFTHTPTNDHVPPFSQNEHIQSSAIPLSDPLMLSWSTHSALNPMLLRSGATTTTPSTSIPSYNQHHQPHSSLPLNSTNTGEGLQGPTAAKLFAKLKLPSVSSRNANRSHGPQYTPETNAETPSFSAARPSEIVDLCAVESSPPDKSNLFASAHLTTVNDILPQEGSHQFHVNDAAPSAQLIQDALRASSELLTTEKNHEDSPCGQLQNDSEVIQIRSQTTGSNEMLLSNLVDSEAQKETPSVKQLEEIGKPEKVCTSTPVQEDVALVSTQEACSGEEGVKLHSLKSDEVNKEIVNISPLQVQDRSPVIRRHLSSSPIVLSPEVETPQQCTQSSMQELDPTKLTYSPTGEIGDDDDDDNNNEALASGAVDTPESSEGPLGGKVDVEIERTEVYRIPRKPRIETQANRGFRESNVLSPLPAVPRKSNLGSHSSGKRGRNDGASESRQPRRKRKLDCGFKFDSDDDDDDDGAMISSQTTNRRKGKEIEQRRRSLRQLEKSQSKTEKRYSARLEMCIRTRADSDMSDLGYEKEEVQSQSSSERKGIKRGRGAGTSAGKEDSDDEDFEPPKRMPGGAGKSTGRKAREAREAKSPGSSKSRKASPGPRGRRRQTRATSKNPNIVNMVNMVDSPTRGSQGLQISVTAIRSKKRKKQLYPDSMRTKMTSEELSTLRLAFVEFYPPPPSNLQAQGRYEQMYGKEMSKEMIRGLWKKELQPWSDRWWKFYEEFNDGARQKKLEKPANKNPTVTEREAKKWAKEFYGAHGDARISALDKNGKPNGVEAAGENEVNK